MNSCYKFLSLVSSLALVVGLAVSGCARKSSGVKLTKNQRIVKSEVERLHEDMGGLKTGDRVYATIRTNLGEMKAELYWQEAPATVANFVGLARGTKSWTDPKTNQASSASLYAGTIFHRVIPGFMIQGGDPLGTGTGGPGFSFKDEFNPKLRHDAPGVLSMANAGPNSNGSQFFITDAPAPFLNNRHSVFGKVIENMELVSKIALMPRGANDRPNQDVVIKEIAISKN